MKQQATEIGSKLEKGNTGLGKKNTQRYLYSSSINNVTSVHLGPSTHTGLSTTVCVLLACNAAIIHIQLLVTKLQLKIPNWPKAMLHYTVKYLAHFRLTRTIDCHSSTVVNTQIINNKLELLRQPINWDRLTVRKKTG